MKISQSLTVAAAAIATTVSAKHGDAHLKALEHRHLHHKARAASAAEKGSASQLEEAVLKKRTGQCQFPEDAGLVSVPGALNGGWAMSPDECCEPGGYCPYACPPGQISMQWDPTATSYSYPQSMNGGLFCDNSGKIKKPFPDRPYCVDGTGNVGCRNKASKNVAICQTVLPGNEAMLIPTNVETSATLAIPGPKYWAGTAAHFYVNPPGVSPEEGCVWGSVDKPHGNWSPYVLGGNAVDGGETFIKLGWNPIYLEPETPFRDVKPSFGIEITCDGDGCNGLPCAIDPSQHGVNELVGGGGSSGAGGAVSCVVTVPAGSSANFVITEVDGKGGDKGSEESHESPPPPPPKKHDPPPRKQEDPSPPPLPTTTPPKEEPTTSSYSTTSETPTPTPSLPSPSEDSSTPSSTTTPTPTPTPTPSPSSSSVAEETSSSYPAPEPTQNIVHLKAPVPKPLKYTYKPHVFADNATMTVASGSAVSTVVTSSPASGTAATTSPLAVQPPGSSGAAYNRMTAAAFALTALVAVAVIAL